MLVHVLCVFAVVLISSFATKLLCTFYIDTCSKTKVLHRFFNSCVTFSCIMISDNSRSPEIAILYTAFNIAKYVGNYSIVVARYPLFVGRYPLVFSDSQRPILNRCSLKYKTLFMLISAEHEILSDHKYKNIKIISFFSDSDTPSILVSC